MGNERDDRIDLFSKLEDPETHREFFARVSDDVHWTVMGTHPLGGTYFSKKAFREATFDRLARVMKEGVRLKLQRLYLDGDTAIVELLATSMTNDGAPFDNEYCWVCRFDGQEPGATIMEVHAYLDSAMVAYAVTHNEKH
jgi:ketosteroid isomerase-like protein